MKKTIYAMAVALAMFCYGQSYAEQYCPEDGSACYDAAPLKDVPEEKKAEEGAGSFVYVTEKIPGANCTDAGRGSTQTTRLYKCTVGKGFDTVVGVLGSLIKYATYLTGLIGVLMIVLSGIQYSLSGGGEDAKKAKGRIIQLVTGLVLLFLTGLILNTVAPWVYR